MGTTVGRELEEVPGLVMPPEHRMHQRAAGVALAAQAMIDAGDPGKGCGMSRGRALYSLLERGKGCFTGAVCGKGVRD